VLCALLVGSAAAAAALGGEVVDVAPGAPTTPALAEGTPARVVSPAFLAGFQAGMKRALASAGTARRVVNGSPPALSTNGTPEAPPLSSKPPTTKPSRASAKELPPWRTLAQCVANLEKMGKTHLGETSSFTRRRRGTRRRRSSAKECADKDPPHVCKTNSCKSRFNALRCLKTCKFCNSRRKKVHSKAFKAKFEKIMRSSTVKFLPDEVGRERHYLKEWLKRHEQSGEPKWDEDELRCCASDPVWGATAARPRNGGGRVHAQNFWVVPRNCCPGRLVPSRRGEKNCPTKPCKPKLSAKQWEDLTEDFGGDGRLRTFVKYGDMWLLRENITSSFLTPKQFRRAMFGIVPRGVIPETASSSEFYLSKKHAAYQKRFNKAIKTLVSCDPKLCSNNRHNRLEYCRYGCCNFIEHGGATYAIRSQTYMMRMNTFKKLSCERVDQHKALGETASTGRRGSVMSASSPLMLVGGSNRAGNSEATLGEAGSDTEAAALHDEVPTHGPASIGEQLGNKKPTGFQSKGTKWKCSMKKSCKLIGASAHVACGQICQQRPKQDWGACKKKCPTWSGMPHGRLPADDPSFWMRCTGV